MGVKNLNKFLQNNCGKKSISIVHLKRFSGKTLVIDTSIYLYKFSGENALLENMYLLISIFLEYQIKPIFIFDGKPPPEKKELLRKRYIEKKEAERKYLLLQSQISDNSKEMELLKKQFIRIREEDVRKVKELMDAFGVTYYDASGEADVLCAHLNKSGSAWGCVSDDMDMFLYGCPYVIRNIRIISHTAILYNTTSILSDLNMTEKQFREIMVLSGTDYNIHSETRLDETIRLFNEYTDQNLNVDFYDWLVKNTTYINDKALLSKCDKLFHVTNDDLKKWENIQLPEKKINKVDICNIMKKEGFVFV